MKLTLRQRLIKYFQGRPSEVMSGGEIERVVALNTTYKASNVSRRLRELSEEGILIRSMSDGYVCYQWNKSALQAKAQFLQERGYEGPVPIHTAVLIESLFEGKMS